MARPAASARRRSSGELDDDGLVGGEFQPPSQAGGHSLRIAAEQQPPRLRHLRHLRHAMPGNSPKALPADHVLTSDRPLAFRANDAGNGGVITRFVQIDRGFMSAVLVDVGYSEERMSRVAKRP